MRCLAALVALLAACAAPGTAPAPAEVATWGTLREVLRAGASGPRVLLADAVGPGAIGVGLLAGLEGEVTVVDGVVHLASVEDGELVEREARPEDSATLLAIARVRAWTAVALPRVESLAELEERIRAAALAAGLEPARDVIPVRIEGDFGALSLHVLDRSCPIAHPDGPPPWRLVDADASGSLVGFYAERSAGRLTHHGQRLHAHAVVTEPDGAHASGHLDAVAVHAGAVLWLPRSAE
jgi:alpha-acetolactate decarboxylase